MIEIFTLLGVVISVLFTAGGWYVTWLLQKDIQSSQNQFQGDLERLKSYLAFEREQARTLMVDNLDVLKELSEWVQQGREIYLDASLGVEQGQQPKPTDPTVEFYNKARELVRRGKEFRSIGLRYFYLAKLWEFPIEIPNEKSWEWGNDVPPKDLMQLIFYYEDEITDQISEFAGGSEERLRPYVNGNFYTLYEGLIRRIEELKQEAGRRQTQAE